MTFLAPFLLLAAAALAVPLILHLFRKRPGTVRSFPALRYLERTTRERARIVRLRQLLLLAVRLAALALIVMAAARLVLPLAGGDQPPAGVVLVVDNGVTSARVVDDRRVLDHLLVRAGDALDRTGPDDRIWVIPAGEPWRPVLPTNTEGARQALSGLEPSAVRADLPAAVNRARSLLDAGAPPLRQILVLSDLDGASLERAPDPHPAEEIPILIGTVDGSLPPNRGFGEVSVGGGLIPRAGAGGEVSVRVAGEPASDQSVRLWIEDRLAAGVRTDADGRAMLALPRTEEGWLTGRLELDPDALRIDDVHYLALPIRPPPRVRVVEGPPSYLATALDVLADRDRIAGPGSGEAAAGARPEVGVEAGARNLPGLRPTLVFPPGDPNLVPAANQRLADLGAGWRFEMPPAGDEALVTDEVAPEIRLPEGLEVHRRYALVPTNDAGREAGAGRVLARLSDGSPWVVHLAPDPNEDLPAVLLVGSAPDPDASRLPTSAAMVPFLGAALELLDGGDPAASVEAGMPIALPPGAHTVRGPTGTPVPVDGISSFLETGRPGIYDVLGAEGDLLGRTAVNPRPTVDDETRLSPGEAAARLGSSAEGTESRREWARGVLQERRGREVWWPLLLGALLLLVAEGWLAAGGGAGSRPVERMETAGGGTPAPEA